MEHNGISPSSGTFGITPVPPEYSESVLRMLDSLGRETPLLIVKGTESKSFAWLNSGKLETILGQSYPGIEEVRAWPLTNEVWLISLRLSGRVEDPEIAISLHSFSLSILERMKLDYFQDTGSACIEPFTITPIAALLAADESRKHIEELNTLLEIMVNHKLGAHFQPIVNLQNGRVIAYEALIRLPKNGLIRRPGTAFHAAERAKMLAWFDLACLEQCFQEAGRLGLHKLLFVNLEAEGLMALSEQERSLAQRARECGLSPEQIVVEVTERQTMEDYPHLLREISRLREEGFRIAVDDAGAGYSSLQTIADLHPDFVKIDKDLVQKLNVRGERRGMLSAIVRYSKQIGAVTLGEGAETLEELAALIELGVQLGQGFVMARPAETFRGITKNVRDFIVDRARLRTRMNTGQTVTVGELKRRGVVVSTETPLFDAVRKFRKDGGLTSIVITEANGIRGILMRNTLERMLDTIQKSEVGSMFPEETVFRWMDADFMSLEESTPIEEAIHQLTRRSNISMDTDIVVVSSDGGYLGVLPANTLIETAFRRQRSVRRHSDPLTYLPGRVILEEALQEKLTARQSVGLVRIDINGLEAYNQTFGYPQGDRLIETVAAVLQEEIQRERLGYELVCHLGGDNFVVMVSSGRVAALCQTLSRAGEIMISHFFTPDQVKNGYFISPVSRGKETHHSLSSLRIAGMIHPERHRLESGSTLRALERLLDETNAYTDLPWITDEMSMAA